MDIAIVGCGAVGLATGKGLAKLGNKMTYVDTSDDKIYSLEKAKDEAFTPDQYPRITTDITMICVATSNDDGVLYLDDLKRATREFARRLKTHKKYHTLVIRSTVPPHTTRDIVIPIVQEISGKTAGTDFGVVMQPEYLRTDTAETDFARPWFVLIGELDRRSGNTIEKLYSKLDVPIERVSIEEAEFQKHVHNAYNAVKIAFFNEMRIIAKHEKWNADVIFHATAESAEGSWNPLYGLRDKGTFTNSPLMYDSQALVEWGRTKGYTLPILHSVITENKSHDKIISDTIVTSQPNKGAARKR
jgi:nucleotide sugar dehydrogenase